MGSINVVFNSPTNKNIKQFRLEYYTRVDKFLNEWNSNYVPKKISKNIIDAIIDIDSKKIDIAGQIVPNVAYINYVWVIPWVKLITTKMENIKDKKNIVITKGTKVYASKSRAKIKYIKLGNEDWEPIDKNIDSNSSVEFEENIKITHINWDIYIKTNDKITLTWWEEISRYIWLPFFSDTKIKVDEEYRHLFNEKSHLEIKYWNWNWRSLYFKELSSYELFDLGSPSSDYLIKVDRQNDFYYAKMYAINNWLKWTYSREVVLSPQKEADKRPPEIDVFWKIRIPVYQKKTIDFTNNIYENSGTAWISDFSIDFDLEKDSDWDWNTKNDIDTLWIKINKTSTKLEVEFWKFNELMKKKIWAMLTDKNWNTSFKELDFEVYAPIPNIKKVENWKVFWQINEDLFKEPVNVYRLRWWSISRLEDKVVWEKVNTVDAGVFNMNVSDKVDWLIFEVKNKVIANINEHTWKINLQWGLGYYLWIKKDKTHFPKINIYSPNNEIVYSEYLKLEDNREISITSNMNNLEKKWIYLKLLDIANFNYYKVPTGVSYNPWATVIYKQWDIKRKPIYIIFPDGRIKIANRKYNIIYKDYSKNVWFSLVSRHWNKDIAELQYNIEWAYLMK